MWKQFDSVTDVSFLRKGYYVYIQFTPHSQKHFMDPNYDFYFPVYYGKIIETSADLDNIKIITEDNQEKFCVDRAGTSGFMIARYYIPQTSADVPNPPDSFYKSNML